MIACNACQLLATDLPFCHGPSSRPFLGPSISILMSVMFKMMGFLFELVSRDSSTSNMTPLGRWPRWRSPRILRIIRGFDLSVLRWCFIRFEARFRGHVRLNLVELVAIMGHLKVIFGLCWVTWCYHGGILNFWSWVVEQVLLFRILLASNLRDLTWISG